MEHKGNNQQANLTIPIRQNSDRIANFEAFAKASAWLRSGCPSDVLDRIEEKDGAKVIPQTVGTYLRCFGAPTLREVSPFGEIFFWDCFSLQIYLMDFGAYRIVHLKSFDLEKTASPGATLKELNNVRH